LLLFASGTKFGFEGQIMRNTLIKSMIAALVLISWTTTSFADVTIKIRLREGRQPAHEMLIRIKGTRQRNDFPTNKKAPEFAWVYHCEKKEILGINYTKKQYFTNFLGESMTPSQAMAFGENQLGASPPQKLVTHGGRIMQTVTVTDTGERREMFGFTARHLKTRVVWNANPSCNQTTLRQETDGWYIDLLHGMECSPDLSGLWNYGYAAPSSKCDEHFEKHKYEFLSKQVGDARFGFPLLLTRTVYGDRGEPLVNNEEVLELSTAELDASLFEVPATFTKIEPNNNRSLFGRLFSFANRWGK